MRLRRFLLPTRPPVLATSATIYRFQVELSDIDRSVYETLELRVARHPSEDEERMVVRVLARAIAHEEGLEFGRGLSTTEDAGLWSHTLTGQVGTWIDVGAPAAERLHRAAKQSERLLVFTHKPEEVLRREWRVRKIHRAGEILVYRLPEDMVRRLAEDVARKANWFVNIHDGVLGVTSGDLSLEGQIEVVSLADLVSAKASS